MTAVSSSASRKYQNSAIGKRRSGPASTSDRGTMTHCIAMTFSMMRERRPAKLRKNWTASASSTAQNEHSMNSLTSLLHGMSGDEEASDMTTQPRQSQPRYEKYTSRRLSQPTAIRMQPMPIRIRLLTSTQRTPQNIRAEWAASSDDWRPHSMLESPAAAWRAATRSSG